MSSVSLFEQLTSSVSLSMVAIVSTAILTLLLVYTVAFRIFFSSSSSKSKDSSLNKDKKSNTKNQQGDTTSSNKKKTAKTKKNTVAVSSSSPTTQSEESENEKASVKKSTTPNKSSTGKKVATGENNKTDVSTNEVKTSSTKQQQVPARTENVEGKKQSKTAASNKQQTSGKNDAITKVNTINSNKKQPAVVTSEVKSTPTVDDEVANDQEDEGQWVTQNNKQVNNRNRNKGKTEISNTNNQTSPSALLNRNVVSEKRSTLPTTNGNNSSVPSKTESDVEPTTPPVKNQEPIEIYQLLPTNENLYTSNDNWWKQTLNQKQTFSINDIGEWPERDQDEQYTIQVKRIIPIKKVNEEQNDNEL